jgi:hypothetical protein
VAAQNAPTDGIPRPDPTLTPGAVLPDATVERICVAGYTKTVRNVTASEKQQVYARYHAADTPGTYEVDHLIALELGGSNEITNLWPEPYAGTHGARQKDALENRLHMLVCDRQVALAEAQHAIAGDWWAAYQRYAVTSSPTPATATTVRATPSTGTTVSSSAHPAGTTGRCKDGTYTQAQHSQGACSHHGGLAEYWGP